QYINRQQLHSYSFLCLIVV
ncbi:hypothetical protein AZ014_000903, partial [Klebsiella pneumoniae]